ncbi:DUF6286 domain-containing protein [Marinactinospora thermotolerans]|uniref:DUF6286 domain-containing protein n=1 Tax=Marinactinospora thermotolerans DSM 45154 TaxID=1122192 RepID=A0A1T4RVY0_9ACTN|nr:DUF6286 domain-containing protein [Marinactinospora thermotolerans]SKA20130.1 hypothetical protein SAMN02745673_03043 [Marinactinospora thermotolerans DSM 45154]
MTTVEDALTRPDPATTRRARRVAVHTFRPRRSWPAFIVGALIVAVAGLAAAEVISTLVGSPLRILPVDKAADYAGSARWNDPSVQVASAVLALIGLVLISLALVPGRGRWTVLRTDDPALVVGLSRAGMRRALTAAACEVDGVRGASVRVGRRRVKVRAETVLRHAGDLPAQVRAAVQGRLDELDPVRKPKVRAQVRYAKA